MTLTAHDIEVKISGATLLDRVSLALAPGKVMALLGPNGAGKSTLLNVLAGLIVPSSGEITLDGESLAAFSPDALARRRGYLAQAPCVAAPFTVAEVAALGRHPWRHTECAAEAFARSWAALERTDAAHLAARPANAISGGEAHRMHAARVTGQIDGSGQSTRYLLMDEPTASLDLAHQHRLLALARAYAARRTGVAIALHDLNLALAYADDAVLLHKGRIVASGPASDVLTPSVLAPVYGVDFALSRCPVSGRAALASWRDAADAVPVAAV